MHISSQNYWWYLMPFAYCKHTMLNFTEMPLLQRIEYYELVLCEVSRLYVKKCLRKIPEKITFVWKTYNGETGLQRNAIRCRVIPGKIKNIYQIETLTKWTFYQVICNNNHLTSVQICRRTNMARKNANVPHYTDYFTKINTLGWWSMPQKRCFYDIKYFIPWPKCTCKASWIMWQGEHLNNSYLQIYRKFHKIQTLLSP